MNKILLGLTMAGLGAVVALGARSELLDRTNASVAPARVAAPHARVTEPESAARPTVDAERTGQARSEVGTGAAEVPSSEKAIEASAARAPETEPRATEAVGSQEPDAAAILQRVSAAYAKLRSLKADFVQQMQNPLLRTQVVSRGTLYQRRPDRFLLRFSDPAGDLIVSDGRYFWIYYPSVDEKQVIRAPAGEGRAGGVDLQAQFLGDPLTRFTPTLEGRETVLGRSAFVLTLLPKQPVGYRKLRVWIDARDHLVRRFELTEENGSVRHFELSNVQTNPTLGDELFRFTPPAGAHVVDRG